MNDETPRLGQNARVSLTNQTRREVRMAQKVHIELVDDLDGTAAEETVRFGMDGTTYEIDLNKKHAGQLRKALAPFVEGARRVAGTKPKGKSSGDTKAIREWARSAGFEISDRGQIPANVREAYAQRK